MKSIPRIETDRIVVIEAGGPNGVRNRCFNEDAIGKDYHGLAACYLYQQCIARNIQLLTSDLYRELEKKSPKAILWQGSVAKKDLENGTRLIKEQKLRPALLIGFEQPLYACHFYWNLKKYTAQYEHTFMPGGARSSVSQKTNFRAWVSPQPYALHEKVSGSFGAKKHLVMINGNTRIHPLKRMYVHIMQRLWPIPTLLDRELYVDRLKAIDFFSRYGDFDLYGRGWNNPVLYTHDRYAESIRRSYRGETEDKLETLRRYKFSICFENAIFGGLVTEKIIDSFFAGCVPVYWGAPDITDYVPKEAFIDFREFKDFEELDAYLRAMDEATYNKYIDAINGFIQSKEGYYRFSKEKYAQDMIELFESYF